MKWDKTGGVFIDLFVIPKVVSREVRWIFHGQGRDKTTGSKDCANGVDGVRGRCRRVDLPKDSNVRLT